MWNFTRFESHTFRFFQLLLCEHFHFLWIEIYSVDLRGTREKWFKCIEPECLGWSFMYWWATIVYDCLLFGFELHLHRHRQRDVFTWLRHQPLIKSHIIKCIVGSFKLWTNLKSILFCWIIIIIWLRNRCIDWSLVRWKANEKMVIMMNDDKKENGILLRVLLIRLVDICRMLVCGDDDYYYYWSNAISDSP